MFKAEASDVEEIVKTVEMDLTNNLHKHNVISTKLRNEIEQKIRESFVPKKEDDSQED